MNILCIEGGCLASLPQQPLRNKVRGVMQAVFGLFKCVAAKAAWLGLTSEVINCTDLFK